MQIKMKIWKYREVVLIPGAVYEIEDQKFCDALVAEGAAEYVNEHPAAEAATEVE